MSLVERSGHPDQLNCQNIKRHQENGHPVIAIVIPAYNEQKLLPFALASIDGALSQIIEPVRTVVVDNNSSDQTGKIARNYGATVLFESKRQIASARQAGLASLPPSVELVLTTDADTLVSPGWIGAYIHLLNQTEIVGAYGSVIYDFEDPPSPGQYLIFQLWLHTSDLIRRIKRVNNRTIGSGANSAYGVDAARKIGGYDTSLCRAEDTDLFRRLLNVGSIHEVASAVVTSNRRIINRGMVRHLLKRVHANLFYLRYQRWPSASSDPRKDIRL